MSVKVDELFDEMMNAGATAFGSGWSAVAKYAPAEFRKMAIQLADIAANVAAYEADPDKGYSPETGKVLLTMQKRALESVLVATTELTLIAVEKAINAILDVLARTFKGALAAVLP